MRILRNADGAALVTALMLSMLALVISMTLLYTVTTGTKIAASQKRYRSALTAAQGGVELLTLEIIPKLLEVSAMQNQLEGGFTPITLQLPQYGCLQQKLNNPTALWSACSDADLSADPSKSPDVVFTLSGQPMEKGFIVSTKIVDTVPGNSDKVNIDYLDPGSSVTGKDEVIHPRHVPGIYNLSIQGAREGGSAPEKAHLSVLYAY